MAPRRKKRLYQTQSIAEVGDRINAVRDDMLNPPWNDDSIKDGFLLSREALSALSGRRRINRDFLEHLTDYLLNVRDLLITEIDINNYLVLSMDRVNGFSGAITEVIADHAVDTYAETNRDWGRMRETLRSQATKSAEKPADKEYEDEFTEEALGIAAEANADYPGRLKK